MLTLYNSQLMYGVAKIIQIKLEVEYLNVICKKKKYISCVQTTFSVRYLFFLVQRTSKV